MQSPVALFGDIALQFTRRVTKCSDEDKKWDGPALSRIAWLDSQLAIPSRWLSWPYTCGPQDASGLVVRRSGKATIHNPGNVQSTEATIQLLATGQEARVESGTREEQ